ncbi:MAG TPA: hypothetical protein VNL73_04480 [Verrucomicrobiae bacterium]|nr:hypothetical protein [Verrucomicrobiae bacterium]
MAYRDTVSFGKRQEFIAIAELLKRGFDVYLTLVDDQQIDCVIRHETKGEPVYLDLQIKARSAEAKCWNAGAFAAIEVRKPRKNYFFVFYSEQAKSYWVMPSLVLTKEGNQGKTGRNKGKYQINFTNCNKKTGKVRPRPRFEQYRDNFDILLNYNA